MIKKSIEDALHSLLPSYSEPLPSELVNLALSLHSQSLTRASSLKPEEEIARTYACANIACERLKFSLNLPKPNARAPCAPRIYDKLYKYLENALPAKQSRRQNTAPIKSPSTKNITPSRPRNTTKPDSVVATPTRQTRPRNCSNDDMDGYPSAAMPIIRRVCKSLHKPELTPHIYTALEVTYPLAFEEMPANSSEDIRITPKKGARIAEKAADNARGKYIQVTPTKEEVVFLIIALFILASARIPNREPQEAEIEEMARTALAVIGFGPEFRARVDTWVLRVTMYGWAEGQEWWDNLPYQPPPSDEEENVEVEKEDVGARSKRRRRKEEERGGLQAGLGTMMQDKVDWLSEEKRLDYEDWKFGITARLVAFEKGNAVAN